MTHVGLTLTDMVDNPDSKQPKRLRHMAPIPSCTEEKYIWIHDLGRGKAINKRVALIAGPRTTETTINIDDYPAYNAIDNGVFALTSATVCGLMEHLAHEQVSYLRLVHTN